MNVSASQNLELSISQLLISEKQYESLVMPIVSIIQELLAKEMFILLLDGLWQ